MASCIQSSCIGATHIILEPSPVTIRFDGWRLPSFFPELQALNFQIINSEYVIRNLGLYSLSRPTSYCKISWSFDATRLRFKRFQPLWNLTGISAAALPICLSNARTIDNCNIQSRSFGTSITILQNFYSSISNCHGHLPPRLWYNTCCTVYQVIPLDLIWQTSRRSSHSTR